MKITLLLLVVGTLVGLIAARPQNVDKSLLTGPSLEYELINPTQPKPKQVDDNAQPKNGSKTFIYDPKDRSWTPVKSTDPEPKEGTLLWNQNNDKWLTQSFFP